MVIVWGYALVAYESETFAGTPLHHWFTGDIVQYHPFYNTLFPITSALVFKFVRFIILSPDKDHSNKVFWEVPREIDHLLPIESTLE